MFRKGFLAIFFVALAFGADNQPNTTTEAVVAHDEDIIPLHSSIRETTLIVLPAAEKAMGVFCGDKTYWNVDVIPGAERYVAVKPSKAGISTDIHIVTDHNNSYTFQAVEGSNGPVALKVFVKPADASSLEKPPVFVSASEVVGLKQQLADAQSALKKVQESSAAQVKTKSEQLRAAYPDTMQFAYNFKKDKPPFNVEAVWHDDKFTYIRAHPQEAPALYEVKDGKPNLIQFELRPDGLYFIPKILDRAYLELDEIGLLVLAYFTIWGSFHRQPPAPQKKKATAQVWPMSPANIDSQQAELDREMEEAKRAAQQAEFAKRRAQNSFDADGPHNAQVNPVSQLRQQLQLEEIRRAHTAAYASTVAFAPQGGHTETKAESVSLPPVAGALPKQGESTPATKPAGNQNAQSLNGDPEPGTYRLDEGTLIETVLLNRLDGEFSGPVITQVANDVYSRAGLELLIPKGSRLLGEAREVNGSDQRRLAILFHRLILANGKTVSLDKFRGLDQVGETGVVSKVDHHYLQIFGTSLALGGIGGLAQIGAYGGYGYDPATGFRVGVTERMGSSAEQVLAKFLNKYPTIRVLEGTRIKVILTNDLNLEAYQ